MHYSSTKTKKISDTPCICEIWPSGHTGIIGMFHGQNFEWVGCSLYEGLQDVLFRSLWDIQTKYVF